MSRKTSQKFDVENSTLEELRSLAGQGDADAQYELSVRYREGRGVPKHLKNSEHWKNQAASQEHVDAQLDIYERDLERRISKRDDKVAIMDGGETVAGLNNLARKGNARALWLSGRAAHKGYLHPAEIADLLGKASTGEEFRMVLEGRGLKESQMRQCVAAYEWCNVAASLDDVQSSIHAEAVALRDKIERVLSADQIEEAQDRSLSLFDEIRCQRFEKDGRNEETS